MDLVHDRGSMDWVHESGAWTWSKEGVHGPLVHVLSSPISPGVEPIKYSAAFLRIRCRQSHTGADELTAISMLKQAKRYSAILSQLQMQLTFSYSAGNCKEMLSGG